jgi:beta-lactamase class A
MRTLNVCAASALVFLTCAACSSQAPAASTDHALRHKPYAITAHAPDASHASAESDAGAPDSDAEAKAQTPARAALDQVLAWLNGAALDERIYAASFTPEFVAAVPFATLRESLASLPSQSEWSIASIDGELDTQLVATLSNGEAEVIASLTVTSEDPPRISGLLIEPAFVAPATASEALARLRSAGRLSLLVASTANQQCEPLLQSGAERSQPIGSAFKLWVLAALTQKIHDGELSWNEPITIQDELDSLPSGTTQDDADGSTQSVRALAERMISISDNTATDHLLARVGREAVERAVSATGHAHPEVNRPLLSTREFFILKFGADTALRQEYLAADEAGRRELLESRVASAQLPELDELTAAFARGPLLIDELEWFAAPVDLCRVLLTLSTDRDAREILASNPGVPAAPGRWSYLGFKGGSEPGVLTAAWQHESADGATYVTVASVANPQASLAESEVAQLMAAVRDFTPNFVEP